MSKEVRTFHVALTTLEPFRIGALQNVLSGIDNPVTTIGGRVVAQGSSLKGAFRAEIEEHLIDQYGGNEDMRPCIPSPRNALSDDERVLIDEGVYRGAGCVYGGRVRENEVPVICPACYLLGAQGLVGFVRVPYLYTEEQPEDLYSVRIDRANQVVAEKTNRDYQVMRDGTVFKGDMEVLVADTIRGWELGQQRHPQDRWLEGGEWDQQRILRELIQERLEAINLLGGFKSKGCGKVEIKVTPVQASGDTPKP